MCVLTDDAGIKECDRRNYRKELKDSRYKDVVPFTNREVVEKIKETYRLLFVKDVLTKYIDDQTAATLNSLIYTSQLDVLTGIEGDGGFQERLFEKIRDSPPGSQERRDCMQLLKEILTLPKQCLRPEAQLFRDLKAKGLFDYLDLTISDPLLPTRLATAEIIEITLRSDPGLLRAFIESQQPGLLLAGLVDRLLWDEDVGLMLNMCDIVTALLDTSGLRDRGNQDNYLKFLYNNFLPLLSRGSDILPPLSAERCHYVNKDTVVLNVLEIYGYIVTNHGQKAVAFITGNSIIKKALGYTRPKEQPHLVLAAIRFVRTAIAAAAVTGRTLESHIIQVGTFERLMDLLRRNGTRYNLVNSAVLEVFDFITKAKMFNFISHVVKNCANEMKEITYVSTFESLRKCYQELSDDMRQRMIAQKRPLSRIDDDDDDWYFNDDDDGNESRAGSSNSSNSVSTNRNNENNYNNISSSSNSSSSNSVLSSDFGRSGSSSSSISNSSKGSVSLGYGSSEYGSGSSGVASLDLLHGTPPIAHGINPVGSSNSNSSSSSSGSGGGLLGYGGSVSPMLQGVGSQPVVSGVSASPQLVGISNLFSQRSPGIVPIGVAAATATVPVLPTVPTPSRSPMLGSNICGCPPQTMSPSGPAGVSSFVPGLTIPSPLIGAGIGAQMSPRPVISPSLTQLGAAGPLQPQIPPPPMAGMLGTSALQGVVVPQSISIFNQQQQQQAHLLHQQQQQQQQQQPSFNFDQLNLSALLQQQQQQPPHKQQRF